MKKSLLKMSIFMMLMFVFVAANAQNSAISSTKAKPANGTKGITGGMTSTNNYAPSSTMVLTFDLTSNSSDAEYVDGLEMTFPAGMVPIVAGSSDPFATYNGCSGSLGALNPIVGQTITWGELVTPTGCGWWMGNATTSVSVGVTIGAISGPQTVSFIVHGDGWGAVPHLISGNITVNQASAHDMGVTSITPSMVLSGSTVAPVVTLQNVGGSAEATWTVTLTDGGSYTSVKSNLSSIAAGATLPVTMDNWTPADGSYTLTATVSNVAGDANAANDVLTQSCTVTSATWMAAAGTIPTAGYLAASCGYFDGSAHYLFSFGGNNTTTNDETQIYNCEAETWSTGATMPTASIIGSAVTVGDFAYVLCGSADGSTASTAFYKYDILGDAWSTLAVLPAAIAWTQITAVGGDIYCVGGNDFSVAYNTVYRYNIAGDAWTTATALPGAIWGGGLATVNGKLVYVMGIDGSDALTGNVNIGTIDGVNPDVITWTSGAACSVPVYKFRACPWIGDKIIVTGGNDGVSGGYWGAIATSWTYDVVTDTWASIMDKTTPTIAYAGEAFTIGTTRRFYCAGGYDAAGAGQLSNVEYYTTDIIVGIDNNVNVESAVSIYPNPTLGNIAINLGSITNATVSIYTLMGELVSSKANVNGTVNFDLSNVAPGIYLVKILSDNKVIDKKINVIR